MAAVYFGAPSSSEGAAGCVGASGSGSLGRAGGGWEGDPVSAVGGSVEEELGVFMIGALGFEGD